MDLLLGAFGLGLLLLGGDMLVRGAVNLALRFGVPALVVGLTVVSFGTSAPELFVSVGSVIEGAPGLALGNVIGSNIANVLLVLGLPAFVAGVNSGGTDTRHSYAVMIGVSVLFMAALQFGPLTWIHGAVFLSALALVLFDQWRQARAHAAEARAVTARARAGTIAGRAAAAAHGGGGAAGAESPSGGADEAGAADGTDARDGGGAAAGPNGAEGPGADGEAPMGVDRSLSRRSILFYLAGGLVMLPLGAHLLVEGAVGIATSHGVSETVIGLTLIAVGTSLPELATTVMAAIRRHAEVALGNVIGSNIMNLLAIIGAASLAGDIPVPDSVLRLDIWVMLAASLALAPFVMRRRGVGRLAGLVLVGAYAAYVGLLLT